MLCHVYFLFFFFKQKTAYEMRISDWSSDVCSSDLAAHARDQLAHLEGLAQIIVGARVDTFDPLGPVVARRDDDDREQPPRGAPAAQHRAPVELRQADIEDGDIVILDIARSEEHTSELTSLIRNSYAVFCWKKN